MNKGNLIRMNDITIIQGDALEQLRKLPDESVQCCVTSPPYYGLRDYQTATWIGGNKKCLHRKVDRQISKKFKRGHTKYTREIVLFNSRCVKCGAIRRDQQIGMERTPDEYVAGLVKVFCEVKRVLSKNGTLWLNIGDTYAGDKGGSLSPVETLAKKKDRKSEGVSSHRDCKKYGLKNKDLIGIPWRLAFALQADGWFLRQDIIWSKPCPMPESVRDRCTKSHEYIFLLSKSQKYLYDYEAIKEPAVMQIPRTRRLGKEGTAEARSLGGESTENKLWTDTGWRNKRSVWTVNTAQFTGSHFAVFPPDLIKPCILAGCPKGAIVLDPFGGSGTTAEVARALGRRSILIELSKKYVNMAKKRLDLFQQTNGDLFDV